MKNEYQHFKPAPDLGKKLDTIRSSAHTKFNNNYHIVWIPKYRKKVLQNPKIKEILTDIIEGQCEENSWKKFALEIMPDHIHLFVSVPPRFAVDMVVKQLKGNSSRQLRRIFPELRTLPNLWARGYYLSTAGYVSQEQVKKYIDKQSEFIHKDKLKRINPQQNRNVEREPQRQLTTIPPLSKDRGFLVGT